MSESTGTFSESWHRVAGQRIALHPGVRVSRQRFRGERWYVLENPYSNQFFRLRPAAYAFVARLTQNRTVESVWRECLEKFPEDAPGQEAVVRLLGQLYQGGLLQYRESGDISSLFDRFQKRRQREVRSKLMNLMFIRIPLFDPDRFLVRALPWVKPFISWFGVLLWIGIFGWAFKTLLDQWPQFIAEGRNVLAPSNLVWLYAGMVVVKTFHEFGHAFVCRRFGGEVHVMGVMLLIFTPVPYMDATSSWRFRSKGQRMLVAGAGMIVELFIAGLAMLVWSQTGSGLVHSLAYNMIFVASVSTLLFNLNPLLRFDGYYILSDLLEIPNLHQRATGQLKHFFEHYLFGVKKSESPATTLKEAAWLSMFGVSSWVYRIFLFAGILLFVADRFLLLGILMAALCIVSWVLVPIGKLANYLLTSPRLDRSRPRAVFACAVMLLMILAPLKLIPMPSHYRAPGILTATERTQVVNAAPGQVAEVLMGSSEFVKAGQPLVQLANPELDLEIAAAHARLDEMNSRIRFATQNDPASTQPLQSARTALLHQLDRLEQDRSLLTIRARQDGIWISPNAHELPGRWLPRGSSLGYLIDNESIVFTATVSQSDADSLFASVQHQSEVRLIGQAGTTMQVATLEVIPAEQSQLPSSALGQAAGGTIAVSAEDQSGRQAAEPFFEVRAHLAETDDVNLLQGRSGRIRFTRDSEPLLDQGWRRFRQLLQKRYQL